MKYLDDTYLWEMDTRVVAQREDYLVLEDTIFHPQGGGQPSDFGSIDALAVDRVVLVDGEIRHRGIFPENHDWGFGVHCRIDGAKRMLHARYHTAGHLLAHGMEEMFPELVSVKCHAFPGEAYVQYQCGPIPIPPLEVIQSAMAAVLRESRPIRAFTMDRREFENRYSQLPYEIGGTGPLRVIQIGNYRPIPCGGTHLATTGEIGDLRIRNGKMKTGILKLSYELP
jgi:alanyl-tRNA synthetase